MSDELPDNLKSLAAFAWFRGVERDGETIVVRVEPFRAYLTDRPALAAIDGSASVVFRRATPPTPAAARAAAAEAAASASPAAVWFCLRRLTDYPLAWQDRLRESRLGFEGGGMLVPPDVYAQAEAARLAAEG